MNPAPEPTKGEQTRRAILDAAIARFGREGYRSTSVADIARDAAVGGTVAYAYFPNKEALFFAAVDEDAAGVIHQGLTTAFAQTHVPNWWQTLIRTLVGALERHPLARRLLAGLEPDVTGRVLEMPALAELRKACAEQLRTEQLDGIVRSDIDVGTMANGIVAIMLSLLMSVVQVGGDAAALYGDDIAAVFEAAIRRAPAPRSTRPPRRSRQVG
ncbi:MAG TPA: TetR/AcrR family transcriptional regulator [Acidimicrobiales bacterium]|nr:TetR/AcrR family transcriptional regulator [Acidimicrobiales bacterium]